MTPKTNRRYPQSHRQKRRPPVSWETHKGAYQVKAGWAVHLRTKPSVKKRVCSMKVVARQNETGRHIRWARGKTRICSWSLVILKGFFAAGADSSSMENGTACMRSRRFGGRVP